MIELLVYVPLETIDHESEKRRGSVGIYDICRCLYDIREWAFIADSPSSYRHFREQLG